MLAQFLRRRSPSRATPAYPAEAKPATATKVVTVPRSPTQNYRVIYNFTGGGDGASPSAGLAFDAAGNFYGTTSSGGPSVGGQTFKLIPGASGWRFSRVYSFFGPNGSLPDSTLVRGPDGSLYGTTYSGGLGDGMLFGLSPAANILPSVFSNWVETLLYSFTGGSDGAKPGGSLVVDSSGNIYGNAAQGGANHNGTLYEFTNGGIQVLHAFPAFDNDGLDPGGVGPVARMACTASPVSGGTQGSGTLYTTAAGYQVLHSFTSGEKEGNPTSLAADQAGNLYAAASCSHFFFLPGTGWHQGGLWHVGLPVVSAWLEPFPPGKCQLPVFSPVSSRVSTDASGNVYGTTDTYGTQGCG